METLSIEPNTMEKMLLQRAASARRPLNGSLELLPLCNMNCDMCYIRLSRSEMEQKGSLHSADKWIRLGEEMKKAGVLFLLLTGGEPLMFPDFKSLYLELKRLGMILTINTNGTLLDEEWADFFGRNKPRRINITLYGADDRAYKTLCHYPGGFDKAMRGIRLLKDRGVDAKISGSVTKSNYKDVQRIYDIGKSFGIPVHMDTYMLPGIHERGLAFEQQSRLLPEEAAEAAIETLKAETNPELFPVYIKQKLAQVQNADAEYLGGITCMAGNCSFTVNWQGKMRPCIMLTKPEADVFRLGFSEAWKEITNAVSKIRLNAECSACTMREACQSCAACAFLETGEFDGVPEYMCQYTKETLRLLKDICEKEESRNA